VTAQSVPQALFVSLLAATLLWGGCSEEVVLDNAGTACLSTSGDWPEGGQDFVADQPLTVVVRFDDCLSSSCDTNRQANCEISMTGDRIVVTSTASYTDEGGAGSSCTTDCVVFETSCETPALAEGDYTLVYGDEELAFHVGSPTGNYCVPPRS